MAPRPHRRVLQEITAISRFLLESGLADDYNAAYESKHGASRYLIEYRDMVGDSPILTETRYDEVYRVNRASRRFNFRMLDGAMIQMQYEFFRDQLVRHRLAFVPSPDLLDFQNNRELYVREPLYADVVDERVVTVPLRFDYDVREGVPRELEHPKSHLTLGEYKLCRIPVTAAVTPNAFMAFILRSFYNAAAASVDTQLPSPALRFAECIADAERRVVHIGVPTYR